MKRKASTGVLALICIVAAASLFWITFFFGGFAVSFASEECKSEILSIIEVRLAQAIEDSDFSQVQQLKTQIAALNQTDGSIDCSEALNKLSPKE